MGCSRGFVPDVDVEWLIISVYGDVLVLHVVQFGLIGVFGFLGLICRRFIEVGLVFHLCYLSFLLIFFFVYA